MVFSTKFFFQVFDHVVILLLLPQIGLFPCGQYSQTRFRLFSKVDFVEIQFAFEDFDHPIAFHVIFYIMFL